MENDIGINIFENSAIDNSINFTKMALLCREGWIGISKLNAVLLVWSILSRFFVICILKLSLPVSFAETGEQTRQ